MTSEQALDGIKDYLTAGGLFNPEFMDHAAVRDLIFECRDALESSEGLLRQAIDALRALQRQALQSSVNDGNEWGEEALEMTRTVLALAKDRGL